MHQNSIRNFVIIAHIDHGKSTLADRMLEITGTVPKRLMRPQFLDSLELERERGITIKMTPVRMRYAHTQINADQNADSRGLLYEDLTYKIRGALFAVYNQLGPSFKESVYGNALAEELKKNGIAYEREKSIDIIYNNQKVGVYRPDFVIEGKVVLEIKDLPFFGKLEKKQTWHYLKGSPYRLGLLINFGSKELQIERIVYDSIRDDQRLDQRKSAEVQQQYVLNLIDTPGHADFSYEVSRALAAVEGAVLLVDATQGMQAQTLSVYESAQKANLTILGVVNKIDIASPEQREAAITELAEFLSVDPKEILEVSGKTGEGVPLLLEKIIEKVPSPKAADFRRPDADQRGKSQRQSALSPRESAISARALIFDSVYDDHKGIIAFIRVFNGTFLPGIETKLLATNTAFKSKEIGYFAPKMEAGTVIQEGEIGYIATGIKDADRIRIGDTVCGPQTNADLTQKNAEIIPRTSASSQRTSACVPLPGYAEPKPVVFVSFYPEEADDYEEFKKALSKLRLTDAALKFEPDSSEVLGRGFKGGFLGRLHFEIAAERLDREFGIKTTHSFPSVAYKVRHARTHADKNADQRGLTKDADRRRLATQINADTNLSIREDQRLNPRESAGYYKVVTTPKDFTDDYAEVLEPITRIEILTPMKFLNSVLRLKDIFRFSDIETKQLASKIMITAKLPLADLIRDLDDKLKSVSEGFASLTYEVVGWEKAEVSKLEILVAGHVVPGLTRILPKKDVEREARTTVERLKELLPQEQFAQAVQASVRSKIIARETVPAMRKDVTGYLYGGDRTRKMKLWKKQQRGKARLKERAEGGGNVHVPASVFRELLKK